VALNSILDISAVVSERRATLSQSDKGRFADDTSSERVLAFAAYYWSLLDEHPP
jgi:hypothetical protein